MDGPDLKKLENPEKLEKDYKKISYHSHPTLKHHFRLGLTDFGL